METSISWHFHISAMISLRLRAFFATFWLRRPAVIYIYIHRALRCSWFLHSVKLDRQTMSTTWVDLNRHITILRNITKRWTLFWIKKWSISNFSAPTRKTFLASSHPVSCFGWGLGASASSALRTSLQAEKQREHTEILKDTLVWGQAAKPKPSAMERYFMSFLQVTLNCHKMKKSRLRPEQKPFWPRSVWSPEWSKAWADPY